jgi:predicted membrane-bound mannosyltransferase
MFILAALCLLAVAPGLHTQVLAAYADVPEACLWVAAVLALARWLWDGRGDLLALSAVFAAGALATKQEGLVLDGALLAVAVLVVAHERSRLGKLALAAAAVALSALPWQIHAHAHDLHDADIAPSLGRATGQLD